jgi:hypothetical protein
MTIFTFFFQNKEIRLNPYEHGIRNTQTGCKNLKASTYSSGIKKLGDWYHEDIEQLTKKVVCPVLDRSKVFAKLLHKSSN